MKHIAIIGGGIAGLAAAYHLQTRGQGAVKYSLFESASAFGGKIVTARERGFVIEGGPDSFITYKPAALELCRELGLGSELLATNDASRKVYVWSRGRLHPMPDGLMLIVPTRIMPFLKSPLISWSGKARMGLEALIPPKRNQDDESLAQFVRRRLGSEALDKIAEPMIAGIYVADAEDLSLQSTFPRFLDMERQYGGLLRGMLAQRRSNRENGNGKSAAPSLFMTLRGGLQQLTDALVARLDANALWTGRRVAALARRDAGYAVALSDGQTVLADAVVFATPAYVTAALVRALDPTLAEQLERIRYVSTATVSLAYARDQVAHPLNGFGLVVPRSERRKIVACSWSSTKFERRAPPGYVLLRAFVGGAHAEELAEQDQAALVEMVRSELAAMMGISANPVLTQVYRWHKANPQYKVGHQARIAEIQARAAQHPGLYLAGSAYHGVGIPDCIQDGTRAASAALSWLRLNAASERQTQFA